LKIFYDLWRQPGAVQTFQPPLKHEAADAELLAKFEENDEISFIISAEPQDGHSACAITSFCSFSKRDPHFLHVYSKIGINFLLPTTYSDI
jgi:hypothetical protein